MFGKLKFQNAYLLRRETLSLILTTSAAGLHRGGEERNSNSHAYTLFGKEIAVYSGRRAQRTA